MRENFSSFIKDRFLMRDHTNFYVDFHAVPVRENFPSFQGDPHDLAPYVLPRASAESEHESAYCNTNYLNNNS